MKVLNLNSFAKAGNTEIQNIVSSIADAKNQLIIGSILKKLGESLIENATPQINESFTAGHVKAVYVKESITSKPDFSGDEIHKGLLELVKIYEVQMAANMPKTVARKKAHFKFTITG